MRTNLALIAATTLAACSSQPANDIANGPANPTGVPAIPPIAPPDPIANPEALGEAALYVGRWAANPGLCETGAWRFEARHLATAGEVSCDFETVSAVVGGYDVEAHCLAEGARSDETIRLRMLAGPSNRMTVASKTFQPIELERCS